MSSTVKSIAYVHTADIDPSVVKSGATWEGLGNICVTAAEKALETPPKGYTPTQRNSLTDIFASIKVTHRSIRLLVALGDEKPESLRSKVKGHASGEEATEIKRKTLSTYTTYRKHFESLCAECDEAVRAIGQALSGIA